MADFKPLDLQENIRVKIIHAENVYFNCPTYTQENCYNKTERSGRGLGGFEAEMANSSVQTESEEFSFECQDMGRQKSTSNIEKYEDARERTATPQGLTAVAQFGISESSNQPSKESNLRNGSNANDELTQKFQNLQLNAPKNHSQIAETSTGHPERSLSLNSSEKLKTSCHSLSEKKKTVKTSFELLSCLIEEWFPYCGNLPMEDVIKVLVLHSEADNNMAEEIVQRLRENETFWAITNHELESIMSIDSADSRKAAIAWADILVPLISNTWLREIDNVSQFQTSTSSLNARYTFQLIQSSYISSGCTNYKIISAVKEGTNKDFLYRPEIRDAIPLMRDYKKFEKTIINFNRFVKIYKNHQLNTSHD